MHTGSTDTMTYAWSKTRKEKSSKFNGDLTRCGVYFGLKVELNKGFLLTVTSFNDMYFQTWTSQIFEATIIYKGIQWNGWVNQALNHKRSQTCILLSLAHK